MVTPLTVTQPSLTSVAGTTVTLRAAQIVHTIQAYPNSGGMTLTMPTAASFLALSGVSITIGTQSDFTVLNRSTTASVTVITPNPVGDMEIQAGHAAIFRMIWLVVSSANPSFLLVRISTTGGIISSGQLLLESSQAAFNAIRILASDTTGGIDIDSGSTGMRVDSTGQIELTSSQAAGNAIQLVALDPVGGIRGVANEITWNGDTVTLVSGDPNGSCIISSFGAMSNAIVLDAFNAAGGIELDAGTEGIMLNMSAGTKELGMFGVGPVVQRTTGNVSAPVAVNGAVTAVFEDSTWSGYTIQDIVGALQDYGLLA